MGKDEIFETFDKMFGSIPGGPAGSFEKKVKLGLTIRSIQEVVEELVELYTKDLKDRRLVDIGKANIELGFMALEKAAIKE